MPDANARVALAAALLLVLTAGCSAGLTGAGGGDAGAGGDGGAGGLAAEPTADREGGGDQPAPDRRQVIVTGHVVLRVDDFGAARRNLTEAVGARGGFVGQARSTLHGEGDGRYRTGRIVLRVPRENYTALLSRVEAGGTVVSVETSTEDVTDRLVDIEARLDSLRTQRERLRELYASAEDTRAILAVEERLSAVQTEIERLEARQQALQRRVAYSTITVDLRESRPAAASERWYDVGVLAALRASVDGVAVTIRALAVGLAYALPYLVVFGLPAGAVGVAWRRRR